MFNAELWKKIKLPSWDLTNWKNNYASQNTTNTGTIAHTCIDKNVKEEKSYEDN